MLYIMVNLASEGAIAPERANNHQNHCPGGGGPGGRGPPQY